MALLHKESPSGRHPLHPDVLDRIDQLALEVSRRLMPLSCEAAMALAAGTAKVRVCPGAMYTHTMRQGAGIGGANLMSDPRDINRDAK